MIFWSFFDRFLIVLGCQHGACLEPKIDQHATYAFLFFIGFILVFRLLLRLGGSYVGCRSVLFSHCFLHRFLVDLGVDFRSIFYHCLIDFWSILRMII